MTNRFTAKEAKLLALAIKVANLDAAEVLSEIESIHASDGFGWRSCVGESVEEIWCDLSIESRLAVFISATEAAALASENWPL